MNELVCPQCNTAFTIDEQGYADILRQVRDEAFAAALDERMALADQQRRSEVEVAVARALAGAEQQRHELAAELAAAREQARSAGLLARAEADEQQHALQAELATLRQQLKAAADLARAEQQASLQAAATEKDAEIQRLRAQVDAQATRGELEVTRAVGQVEKERDQLRAELERSQFETRLAEQSLKERYEVQLREREEQIERLKDLKAKLSTKMVGETLEQHCEIQFNQLRSTAFRGAYFEKDNDARSGSKGDYIFREVDGDVEVVSIMFEMKNENETTATKHRNEDFLKELDKDRREKGCEYAVLVSMLEADSELYNSGIVDMSHRFEKMYVIRPQFFIPMITLLRNANANSLAARQELEMVRRQNIDITRFEDELEAFKTGFARNYDLASRKFATAIEQIDRSIAALQKTKDNLLGADNNLRLANNKAADVTIKKLTRNNPTMRQKFDELSQQPAVAPAPPEPDRRVVPSTVVEPEADGQSAERPVPPSDEHAVGRRPASRDEAPGDDEEVTEPVELMLFDE